MHVIFSRTKQYIYYKQDLSYQSSVVHQHIQLDFYTNFLYKLYSKQEILYKEKVEIKNCFHSPLPMILLLIYHALTSVAKYHPEISSPRNEHFDLLVRIKFWNLFLYITK